VISLPSLAYAISLIVLSSFLTTPILGVVNGVALGKPNLKSHDFHLDRIVDGLSRPTGLTFLGQEDYLVIEEDTGKIKRVIDGEITQTLLDLDVSTDDSRGLIDIDSYQNESKTFVFLY
jgi:aldose sugar dehydrogenase